MSSIQIHMLEFSAVVVVVVAVAVALVNQMVLVALLVKFQCPNLCVNVNNINVAYNMK